MTLRITTREDETSIGLKLEGRLAGPVVDELRNTWNHTASRLRVRRLLIDLCDITYIDEAGKSALRQIFQTSDAELYARSPFTHHLVEEIRTAKEQ